MKYAFIQRHRCRFSVTKMCQVLQVSRSGFYAWAERAPSPTAERRLARLTRIRAVFAASGQRYGSPKSAAQLRREGDRVGRKTVARLMPPDGLRARVVRRDQATTNARHRFPVAENVLAQQFTATRPPQMWMADITYWATDEGWLYRASLEDLYTRQSVGWAAGPRMTQDLVLATLDRAVPRYRPPAGLFHHSDRGSQYAGHASQARLEPHQRRGSMSLKGHCWDNACLESWHSLLKKELVYLSRLSGPGRTRPGRSSTSIEIFDTRQRLPSALGYRTPAEVEADGTA
jgi:putative transposase